MIEIKSREHKRNLNKAFPVVKAMLDEAGVKADSHGFAERFAKLAMTTASALRQGFSGADYRGDTKDLVDLGQITLKFSMLVCDKDATLKENGEKKEVLLFVDAHVKELDYDEVSITFVPISYDVGPPREASK